MTRKANAGGRKATGNRGASKGWLLQLVGLRITGRIRAVARTRKGADAGQVSPWSKQLMTRPEPKDKLGTTTASTGGDMFAVPCQRRSGERT